MQLRAVVIIACWLLTLGPAHAQDPATGVQIISDRAKGNCLACHALPGQTGITSNFGPTLSGIGARYNAVQLRQWVVDARQIKPDTWMPPFGSVMGLTRPQTSSPVLTSDQIDHVVAALQTWR